MTTPSPARVLCLTSANGRTAPPTLPERVAAQALIRSGRSVAMVLMHDGVLAQALTGEGVEVLIHKGGVRRTVIGRLTRPLDAARITRRAGRIDCVLSLRMSSTPLALAVGRRSHVPVLTCMHGYSESAVKYTKYGVPTADGVLAVSEYSMNAYIAAAPEAGGQIRRVVRNGIAAAAFRERAGEFDARARLGVPGDAPLVGMSGAYFDKGLDVFLRACASVRERMPEARFLVLGGFRDPAFEAEVRDQLAASALADAVHLVGQQANVAPFMDACDVYALPTRKDAFPMVALEAMALGLPVVASRVGGLPEIVKEGESGFLVPPGSPDALAERLLELLEDERRRATMGEQGRARVESALSWEAHEEAFLSWIEEVVQSRPLPARSSGTGAVLQRPVGQRDGG